MPHELANVQRSDPPQLHARYLRSQVDEDGCWDEAVIAVTAIQRHYRFGMFAHDWVDGSESFAAKLIAYLQRNQAEILRECGYPFPTTED